MPREPVSKAGECVTVVISGGARGAKTMFDDLRESKNSGPSSNTENASLEAAAKQAAALRSGMLAKLQRLLDGRPFVAVNTVEDRLAIESTIEDIVEALRPTRRNAPAL